MTFVKERGNQKPIVTALKQFTLLSQKYKDEFRDATQSVPVFYTDPKIRRQTLLVLEAKTGRAN